MKPRKREKQKQTSRLYLRKKDHRDVICNDIYYNAMWLTKEDNNGEPIDTLVWLKYPQRCLYLRTRYSGYATPQYYKGWLDLDRLWINCKNDLGSSGTWIVKLKDYVISTRESFSTYFTLDATKDGCMHKTINLSGSGLNLYPFKDNNLIKISRGTSVPVRTISWRIYNIDDFSIDNFEVSYKDFSHTFSETNFRFQELYYLGTVGMGCLIYMKNQGDGGAVYEIRDNGYCRLVYEEHTDVALVGNGSTRAVLYENALCVCNSFALELPKEQGMPQLYNQTTVVKTSPDGRDWSRIGLLVLAPESPNKSVPRVYNTVRNGNLYNYAIFSPVKDSYLVWAFKNLEQESSNQTELYFPVRGEMGKGTLEYPVEEYVRIQLASHDYRGEPIEYYDDIRTFKAWTDVSFSDIYESWGSIEFKDGEIQLEVEEEFIILSADYGGGRTIYFYVSADLKPNIDNYAFISDSFNASNGNEYVIEGDYVLGGNG